jgi:hypothetical protein
MAEKLLTRREEAERAARTEDSKIDYTLPCLVPGVITGGLLAIPSAIGGVPFVGFGLGFGIGCGIGTYSAYKYNNSSLPEKVGDIKNELPDPERLQRAIEKTAKDRLKELKGEGPNREIPSDPGPTPRHGLPPQRPKAPTEQTR